METNGEQIIKKAKIIPKWIFLGYIICVIMIIGSIYWINYREENETPEPIDFTTDGAVGIETDQYAYFNVQGLTKEVAIYGDVENEYSSENDRYYIAFNKGFMYIVDLNFETFDLLKPWQDYIYSEEENPVQPETVTIYGITESIPSELKKMIIDFYNEGLEEALQITEDDFENYFGTVLLNARRKPVDTTMQALIICAAIFILIIIFIIHIAVSIEKNRVKRYLKKNDYEEDLSRQLEEFVEEKHYKNKVILTKDFFVDIKYGGMAVFKFSDVKWIHVHNIKTYGITASSSLIVYLRDGKTKIQGLEIPGSPTDEFMGILNRILEKLPPDTLKGYTPENKKAFKIYKKELKN